MRAKNVLTQLEVGEVCIELSKENECMYDIALAIVKTVTCPRCVL